MTDEWIVAAIVVGMIVGMAVGVWRFIKWEDREERREMNRWRKRP